MRTHRIGTLQWAATAGAAILLAGTCGRATAALVTFTNAAGGLAYDTAGNWSSGAVPTAGDDPVQINATYAVTLNSDVGAGVPTSLIIGDGASNSILTLGANAVLRVGSTLNLGTYPGGGGGFWGRGTLTMNGGSLHVGAGDAIRIGVSPSSASGAMTLNNGATLQYDGADFYVAAGGSGSGGTLIVNSGATITAASATLKVGNFANTNGVVNINGGSVSLAAITAGITTYNSGTGGVINQSGGSVTVSGNVVLGPAGSSASANGKYTLSGGTLTIAGANGLTGGGNPYGYGLLTLTGGTLKTNAIRQGRAASGMNTQFSGGTLSAYSAAGLLISSPVELQTGGTGAIFDTTVGSITVSKPLTGSGGFTQQGPGILALQAANTYTGDTFLDDGTFNLTSAGSMLIRILDADNTRILGDASHAAANFNGAFKLDLSAVTIDAGVWSLVDVANLNETFGVTFSVIDNAGLLTFAHAGNLWTSNDGQWSFNQSTGKLTLIPEPATLALLAVGGLLALPRRKPTR